MESKIKAVSAAVVLASIQKKAKPLSTSASSIVIVDNKTYELKAAKVAQLKELAKLAEAEERKFLDPLTKLVKDIKELFAPFKTMVSAADAEAKKEMLAYRQQVAAKQLKVKSDLASGKIAKLSTASNKLAALEIVSSNSQTRKIWVLKEIDANVTPREYMVPDESKIKKAFLSGEKVLGWEWVQEEKIAI